MNKQAYFKMMGVETALEKTAEKKAKETGKVQPYKPSNRSKNDIWASQTLGKWTAPLVAALIGAKLGPHVLKNTGPENQQMITGAGLGLGAGLLADRLGRFAGIITGHRYLDNQNDYNASSWSSLLNLIIPGLAQFNSTRTQATNDQQAALLQEYIQSARA